MDAIQSMSENDMTETEKMVLEINGFFRAIGELELEVSKQAGQGELAYLREVREAYTARLLVKIPQFRSMSANVIPDMFLQALRNREAELLAKGTGQ